MSPVLLVLSLLLTLCLAAQSLNNPQDSAIPANLITLYSQDVPILSELFFNRLESHLTTGLELIIFTGAEAEWAKMQTRFKTLNGTLGISLLANLNEKDLDNWTVSDVRTVWNESLVHLLDSFQLLFHFGCEFDCGQLSEKEAFLRSFLPKDLPSDYPEAVAQGRKMILNLFAKMDHSKLDPKALKFFQMIAFPSNVSLVVSQEIFYSAFAICILLIAGNLGFLVMIFKKKKSHTPYK